LTTDVNEPKAGRKEWIGLGVIALPCVLYSMDLTVLNLALPRISAELAPTSSQLLWIVDIYGFLVAGFLITMGNLGDRIGRRRLLLIGAVAFGAASVLAAFSSSASMLIAARAVLGVAGATLAPSTLSLIRNMFLDPEERSLAIGVWISSYTVGGALGPVLGGFMLHHFWWGSVFLLAVPVMLLLLALGPVLLPEYRDSAARPLDLRSAGSSLIAVLSVIYGMKRIAEHGLSLLALGAILGGVVVAVLFGRRQQRLADPLIDLRLFRVPAFSTALATFTLGTLVVFGAYIFVGQYLQLVLGLSPMEAGLWMLPSSVGFIVGSMLAPALGRRVRPALVMGIGLALAAIGFGLLAQVERLALPGLVAGTLIYALGLAPVFTIGTDLIVGSAPPERAGAAAAMSETASELGGALGIATLGSFGTAIYRAAMAEASLSGVSANTRELAQATLGAAAAAAAHLPDPLGHELLLAARAAFNQAFTLTVGSCALLAAVAAAVSLVLLRRFTPRGETPPNASDAATLGGH
jgi:DHA2 family multidrug resistance protein-like MFS transporter